MIVNTEPRLNFTYDPVKHLYYRDATIIPHPTGVLARWNDFSKINPQTLENAREFGNTVHQYLAAYNNGTLDLDAELPKVDNEYDMGAIVRNWDMESRNEVYFSLATEKTCFHKKLMYGCTIDFIAAKSKVIDFKPMSAMNKPAVGVQLAANAGAAAEEGIIELDGVELISWHYDAWGKWKMKPWPFKENWNIWMCILTAHNHFGGEK